MEGEERKIWVTRDEKYRMQRKKENGKIDRQREKEKGLECKNSVLRTTELAERYVWNGKGTKVEEE